MALLDITGGTAPASNNLVQPAVGSDIRTAPTPDAFVSATVAQKLDADLYTAHETGDSGEGVNGSGNLNHTLLQAQQNDLITQGAQGESATTQDLTLGNLLGGIASRYVAATIAPASNDGPTTLTNEVTGSGSIQSQSVQAAQFMPAETITKNDGGSITASETTTALAPITPVNGGNGVNGTPGTPGPAGTNGTNGRDGLDGRNGIDGTNGGGDDCCGCSIVDIDIIGPITIVGPVTIGDINIGNIIGDTIINGPLIDLGDVTTTITTLTTTITNILNPLLDPPPAGGDTDLIVDLGIADLPLLNDTLQVPLDIVETIVGDIDINAGVDGVLQGDNTTVSLDGILLGNTLPPVEITLPVTVETLLADPVGSVTDTLAALPDVINDITDGLLTPPTSGDTDIIADLDIAELPVLGDVTHVPLDTLEAIVGDIDINLGVEGVLQGGESTVNLDGTLLGEALPPVEITLPTTVEEILRDPAQVLHDVLSPSTEDGDTDLMVDTGILPEIHVPLDVVESITGDIDIDVTAALDSLTDCGCITQTVGDLLAIDIAGDALASTVGSITNPLLGSSDAAWPTTPSADLGDSLIDSVLGSIGGRDHDTGILAPIGNISEGIGLLDVTGGASGGLLSSGKTGGMFGGLFG